MNGETDGGRHRGSLKTTLLTVGTACGISLAGQQPARAQQVSAGAEARTRATPDVAPLLPDTVLAPPGQPRIFVLAAPGNPVVALRASLPVAERPEEAGAARLLAELGAARARTVAGPVDARIEGQRTPHGLAYTVTGAAGDFDYLAYLLRIALAPPRPSRIDFGRARARLIDEIRRSSETPLGRVVRRLREAAFPRSSALGGTVGSLSALTPAALEELWSRSHRPELVTVIVTGDIAPELLLASLTHMGQDAEPDSRPPAVEDPRAREGGVQVLRRWFGETRPLPDAGDPRSEVAALLLARHVREVATTFEGTVELWEVGNRRALTVIGAAYRRAARTMQARIRGALEETAAGLTQAEVESAVARVRASMLFEGRTPWGRAEVVGRHLDRTGSPDAAVTYLDRLDGITTEDMRGYLTELSAVTPLRAEVTP